MRIIISPAKKMNVDRDSFSCRDLPRFLPKTEQLYQRLRAMSYEELKALWKCNDQIAGLNYERLQRMELRRGLTPAILSYEGIQYQYMAPRRVHPGGAGVCAGAPADSLRLLRHSAAL